MIWRLEILWREGIVARDQNIPKCGVDRKRSLRTLINSLFFVWCLLLCGIGYSSLAPKIQLFLMYFTEELFYLLIRTFIFTTSYDIKCIFLQKNPLRLVIVHFSTQQVSSCCGSWELWSMPWASSWLRPSPAATGPCPGTSTASTDGTRTFTWWWRWQIWRFAWWPMMLGTEVAYAFPL